MSTRSPESNPAYAGFYPVIAPLIMTQGIGDGKTSSCLVAQSATIDALRKGKSLSAPTDQLECACPLLRRMAIRANDTAWWESDEERTEILRPLIPLLLDSKQSQAITWKRIFFVVDKVVRELTPMRLEYIGREEDVENIKTLRSLAPITYKKSARNAADLCAKFKQKAYADASASASAYAYAYAYADAYAYAYAYASADASASASAYAYAYADADAYAYASASASAYAYADAYAYAYAYASADADAYAYAYAYADADAYAYAYAYADAYGKSAAQIKAQRLKYRAAYIQLFRDVAAITS